MNDLIVFHDGEIPIIHILGLELYLDDLIILFIMFILYNENNMDKELLICLFLLLFS